MISLKKGLSALAVFLSLISVFLPWIKAYYIASSYEILTIYFTYSNELVLNLEALVVILVIAFIIAYLWKDNVYYLLTSIFFDFIAVILGIISIMVVSGQAKKVALDLAISRGELPSVNIYFGEGLFLLLVILILLIGQLTIEILE